MYPKIIKKQYKRAFQVSKDGLYAIEITARCKNWWQNKLRLFDDDDLRVEIDGIKFPKLYPKKRRLFNGPADWNGNKLKNLSKTNIFIIYLSKGSHTLQFYSNQKPVLEKIDVRSFTKNLIKKELQAEDGNRRPWITVILANLPLNNLSITASAQEGKAHEKNKRDGDDIKLIINGQIQKNTKSKSYKYWYWRGKIIKGRPKIFLKKLNFESAIHYIELWADRMPTLQNIELEIDKNEFFIKLGKVVLYKDIIESDFVNLRSEPEISEKKGKKDNIIAQLKDGDKVEIIEEIIESDDYVQNKSNIWHKIKYYDKIGYILSSFVESEGQERKVIIEKIKQKVKEFNLDDKDVLLALAGCESRYKPYAVSHSGAKGIFQLTTIAIYQIKKATGFEIKENEVFNVDKNIEGGIRYYKWLRDTYYKGVKQELEKTITAWNTGQKYVPADSHLDFKRIPAGKREEAQKLLNCVIKNKKRKKWYQILAGALGIISLLIITGIFTHNSVLQIKSIGETKFKFYEPSSYVDIIEVSTIDRGPLGWETIVKFTTNEGSYYREYPGYLENAYLFGFDFHDPKELFLVREEGQHILTTILRYNETKNEYHPIDFIDKNGYKTVNLCCSYIIYKPHRNGVNYDFAIQAPDYDEESGRYIGSREIIYDYDCLKEGFYETATNYISYIPGG